MHSSHCKEFKGKHGGIVLAKSKQQQEAHGIGQVEQQLNNQIEAAAEIQGQSKLDREIKKAADRRIEPSK